MKSTRMRIVTHKLEAAKIDEDNPPRRVTAKISAEIVDNEGEVMLQYSLYNALKGREIMMSLDHADVQIGTWYHHTRTVTQYNRQEVPSVVSDGVIDTDTQTANRIWQYIKDGKELPVSVSAETRPKIMVAANGQHYKALEVVKVWAITVGEPGRSGEVPIARIIDHERSAKLQLSPDQYREINCDGKMMCEVNCPKAIAKLDSIESYINNSNVSDGIMSETPEQTATPPTENQQTLKLDEQSMGVLANSINSISTMVSKKLDDFKNQIDPKLNEMAAKTNEVTAKLNEVTAKTDQKINEMSSKMDEKINEVTSKMEQDMAEQSKKMEDDKKHEEEEKMKKQKMEEEEKEKKMEEEKKKEEDQEKSEKLATNTMVGAPGFDAGGSQHTPQINPGSMEVQIYGEGMSAPPEFEIIQKLTAEHGQRRGLDIYREMMDRKAFVQFEGRSREDYLKNNSNLMGVLAI